MKLSILLFVILFSDSVLKKWHFYKKSEKFTEFAIAFMAFFRLLCYQQTYYHRDEAFCRHTTVSACPAYGCGGGANELCARD